MVADGLWVARSGPENARGRCSKRLVCRLTAELDEVLAKIKAKAAEQDQSQGEERLDKLLAAVDKKAVAANRAHILNRSAAATTKRGATHDPYSRKRTIEKLYWSTGTKAAEVVAVKQEEQLEEAQARALFFSPRAARVSKRKNRLWLWLVCAACTACSERFVGSHVFDA